MPHRTFVTTSTLIFSTTATASTSHVEQQQQEAQTQTQRSDELSQEKGRL
jgi:hypothetical protein